METAVQKANNQITFTDDQVSLIKRQIAPKATNDELKLFLYQASRTGLDPMNRQIYCIHRKSKDFNGNWVDKMTIQTSIDGFRVIAERSGDYAGQNEPEFIYTGDKLTACKITVFRFRGEQRYPAAVGVAYWDEYVQTDRDGKPMGLWGKMKHTMLSKVAEALALRKAYPQDLSGLYTTEEMQQATNGETPQPATVDQAHTEVTESMDDLHKEFMGWLNQLISIQGQEAMRYHPDEWKKERTIKTYKAAIEDIRKKVMDLLAEPV
jgi:phage recombination protein Bet